jgi:hypothetical protein
MGRSRRREFFICSHCGAEVPAGAMSCRECGSDDETGWSESAGEWEDCVPSSGYGSDDEFDYDEFVANEFPDQAPPSGRRRAWRAAVAIVVVAFSLWALVRFCSV